MKIFILFLFFVSFLYGKKDFYYSFIDSNGKQISEKRKQQISDGFDIISNVRILTKDGNIDDAYAQIKAFKEKNKLKVLESDIVLLYSEISLRKKSKRFILEASKVLEDAINSSKINEYDLSKAYMLLIDLKLNSNKTKDAKYFANIIINNFDDELTKTYGKIYLAKIYKYQKIYGKAIRALYTILAKTKNKLIATIVADELFDVYIADGKFDEAKKLISNVLKKNMNYYANDSYLAIKQVNKLIKVDLPQFAVEILQELLNRTDKEESIENFKFKLANTYMMMYDRTNFYLEKSKELYKDILNDYPQGAYAKRARMYIDEIDMRQGRLKPSVLANRYGKSESMKQKVLLQELLNDKADKNYEKIFKSRKIYRKISDVIAKRFGYMSIKSLYDEINIEMIKDLLSRGKCFELEKVLKTSRKETLDKLIKDEKAKYDFFECLIEVPNERAYEFVKNSFNKSRDANIYLYLERMAFSLLLNDEALDFSAKVEMVNNEMILAKEFLYRYQILKSKGDSLSMEKFFFYARNHKNYIELNKNNPVMIDFYYDYYLYLKSKNDDEQANEILNKLYLKQKDYKAKIYSPFVETELSRIEKDNNNLQKALDYLLEGLKNTRKIKANDEIKAYYDILNLYDNLGNKNKKEEYISKCKEVKGTENSLYKKMCDEM